MNSSARSHVLVTLAVIGLSLIASAEVAVAQEYTHGPNYVAGVTATASSESHGRLIAWTVDGAGRNTAVPDGGSGAQGMWMSAATASDPTPWAKFDLGSSLSLDHVEIYNYNEVGGRSHTDRGVATMDVSYSNDDVTYTPLVRGVKIPAAPGVRPPATWGPSASITLGVTARYVKFSNLTSHGDPGHLGLNEVEFYRAGQSKAGPCGRENRGKELVLAKQGRRCAAIVIDRHASHAVREQAEALRWSIFKMTGVKLLIVDDRATGLPETVVCVGPSELTKSAASSPDQAAGTPPKNNLVRVAGRKVILAGAVGPDPREWAQKERLKYAVHTLLRTLGVRYYRNDPLYLLHPKCQRLAVPTSGVQVPPPAFLATAPNSGLDAWGSRSGAEKAVAHSHIWTKIVTFEKYSKTHPEYFAEIDGKRGQVSVLCETHPEVIAIFAEAAATRFARGEVAMSLTPNDCTDSLCQCDRCIEEAGKDWKSSDRLVRFANAVRRELDRTHPEFKDRKLMILAGYGWPQQHIPPSEGVTALPGVVLWVAHQGCHTHCWDDPTCSINKKWAEQLQGWKKAAHEPIGIYEYAIYSNCNYDRKWSSFPIVSVRRTVHDIAAYRDAGVGYLYYENEAKWPRYEPFRWVNAYAIDRDMANPDIDPDKLLSTLCEDLYGPAARLMFEYYDLLQRRLEESSLHAANWYLPDPVEVYSEADIKRLGELIENAVKRCRGPGGDILERCLEAQRVWREATASMEHADRDKHEPKHFRQSPWQYYPDSPESR